MLNLLATICICMGLGVNSNPIYNTKKQEAPKPLIQKASENPNIEEYELAITSGTVNYNNYNYTFGTNVTRNLSNGYATISGSNTALTVTGTSYIQNVRDNTNNTVAIGKSSNGNYYNELRTSKKLIILQITPNYINRETTLYFRTYVNLVIDGLGGHYPTNYIGTTLIQTTEDVSTYINSNNVTNRPLGLVYDEITSPANGYLYSQQSKGFINTDYTRQFNKEIEYEITIQENVTQYLVFFMDWGLTYTGVETNNYIEVNRNNSTISNVAQDTTKILGTLVIPVNTTEVIDIPGVMFDVLTMPFTFISIAFNLTLFPGTPYQLNLSNLFLVIFAVLVFVFLIKMIVGVINKGN